MEKINSSTISGEYEGEINMTDGLSSSELDYLDNFLSQVNGGKILNTEALDGFLAALVGCPDLIKSR